MGPEEVRKFLRENAGYFSAYASSVARDSYIADEVVQNSWARALLAMKKPGFNVDYPKSWMTAIINHEHLNYLRKEKRTASGRWVELEYDPPSSDEIAPVEVTESNAVLRKDLDGLLAELSPTERGLLDGLARGASYRDLSKEQDLGLGSVRARIHRLRKYLREQLARWTDYEGRYAS